MKGRLPLESIQYCLDQTPNKDRTIQELAEKFDCCMGTMRKKCQLLVADPDTRIALLVYQRQRKTKKGTYFFQLCGGYCSIDSHRADDDLHDKFEQTMQWAKNLGSSAKKLILHGYLKKPNVLLLKKHALYLKRIGEPRTHLIPLLRKDDDYESTFNFG